MLARGMTNLQVSASLPESVYTPLSLLYELASSAAD